MSGPLSISVIVPVRDGGATIERCLEAIYASDIEPHEVIVVDDGCTDGTIDAARRFPCRIIRAGGEGGVAAARNRGAAESTGEVLFFTDADVILLPGALRAGREAIRERSLDVAVGLQSATCEFRNATSVYKNLWLRYTYLRRAGRFSVLYSSAVAIRREAFEAVGGFDVHYRRPNIEDSELGKRLSEAGCAVGLVSDLEFIHIKRYNVVSMLKTDYLRTVGMIKVQLRDRFSRIRRENYTSIPTSFLLSCLAPWAALMLIAAPSSACAPAIRAALLPALPFLVLWLNIDWLKYIARHEGMFLALKGGVLVHLDIAAVNLGLIAGAAEYATGKKY